MSIHDDRRGTREAGQERIHQGIVPSYLLSRLAESGRYPQAAEAARQTLIGPLPAEHRAQLRLSIDENGTLVAEVDAAPNRTISDAHTTETLPGTVVRREDDPPVADMSVNQAYDGLGATFQMLLDAFQRNSIDGKGSPLDATVHYGSGYDNAFWNGERMVFGDGDGQVFQGFTGATSVIGHELGHGVIQATAGLAYQDQPGALNESCADVFGALTEQHLNNQTVDRATWLIGAGIFTHSVHGKALRSMLHPGTAYDDPELGKDPQPADLSGYVKTTEDNGGVHINSGIPNRAFALFAVALGGYAWETAGSVWYRTLSSGLSSTASFAEFAHATITEADKVDAATGEAARTAWASVGVIPAASVTGAGDARTGTAR
ncbi:M4 family metallopeptidase [Microbacterium capsulatum]|uniref:Neutral metalloproteinase n=1 Tax=Microbacterium capsulatum TaxID=3041921 RepID=A0ABU0XKD4_9MICO|nr:M4 family metallopeptidase [Microbacterium sp. ASV81]MDQ4215043.1 M4 family metallopeptidase [Microbacterium sp. ASV81]